MKNRRLAWFAVLPAALLGAALGCSFSNSSESASDSSTSSSDSIGSSSGEKDAAFRHDVEQYTAAFVKAGGSDGDGFYSGLGDLARQRGLSDWEAVPGTWESIGRGLGAAAVTDAERHALVQAWAGGDAARRHAIERGYEASR